MSSVRPENSLIPTAGWHCRHFFYRWRRDVLRGLEEAVRGEGREQFVDVLDPGAPGGPARLQTFTVSGHKADFGLLALDSDPLLLDGLHQRLMSSPLGPALQAVWSFVSLTEVSEYVPTVERYVEQLAAEVLPEGMA